MRTPSTKCRSFKGTGTFTRPADTTAYTAGDSVSNSTSAPSVLAIDLASCGVRPGQYINITNVRVMSSVKGSGLSLSAWIMPSTFAATNDNSEFSISDAINSLGGVTLDCNNPKTSALNSKVTSDPSYYKMKLADGSTTIYVALQAISAYTPASAEVFDVIVEGDH